MDQDKTLQSLFEQFEKGLPELKTVQEVEHQLQNIKVGKKYSIKKISIIMGSLSIIAVVAYLLATPTTKTPVLAAPQIITTPKEEPKNTELVFDEVKENTFKNIEVNERINEPPFFQKPILENEIKVEELPNSNLEQLFENANITLPQPIDTLKLPSVKVEEKLMVKNNSFLRLSNEELYRLGIVGKDGGIFYEETLSKRNPFSFSYIVKGSSYSTTFSGGTLSVLAHPDKYPTLITNIWMTKAYGMLNRKNLKDTLEIYNNHKKYLPILVSNKLDKPHPYYSNEMIFWLPKSNYYISLLPARVQSELKANPDTFSWDMKSGRQYKQVEISKNADPALLKKMLAEWNASKVDLLKDVRSISADKNLLSKLGFKTEKNNNLSIKLKSGQFHYKVYVKDSTTNIISDCPSAAYYDEVKNKYKLPIPLFVSDSLSNEHDLEYLRASSNDDENNLQAFLNQKHMLTPVRVNFGPLSQVQYYWYENTPRFLNCLDHKQLAIANTIMQDSAKNKLLFQSAQISTAALPMPDLKDIYYAPKAQFDKINPLPGSLIQSEQLGYRVVDNNLRFFVKIDTKVPSQIQTTEKLHATILTLTKNGTSIESGNVDLVFSRSILPEYITDDLGKNTYIKFSNDTSEKSLDFNHLIPVLVKTGRSYNVIDMVEKSARPDYLLWYAATPAFLKLLPKQESEAIQKELKAAVIPSDSVISLPCKYTDVCKQHKEHISSASIYPNPANTQLNIAVKFTSIVPLTISIADLSGKVVLQKAWVQNELEASTQVDVSTLDSGIYYLYIFSANGDMVVQKILVNH
ncbi:MAG: T9SS type A sorting domain-containing protein [bacterium]|nr:T9SS type A sorting domain-containing protein [bacterium]